MKSLSGDLGYGRLKNRLIDATGLAFYAERDTLLAELISGRLAHLGLSNCSAYNSFLANGDLGSAEMEMLIARLTIGETYFFRDPDQFAAIREIILPNIQVRKKNSRELRIWSAGCSNGAEPYSLAILLMDQLAERLSDWDVRIYASDLNRSFLAQAAEGKFRAWSLRDTPEEMRRKCFTQEGRIWTIHRRYQKWVSFHHTNLVGGKFSSPLPGDTHFDLILCRNVMIYFAVEVTQQLIGQLHGSLENGGWLLVGAPEYNPHNFSAFRTVAAPGALLYQKVATPAANCEVAAPATAPRVVVAPRVQAPAFAEPVPFHMDGLRQLVDRGDWLNAAEYAERLLAQDRLNPTLHFYRGLILENVGNLAQSERSLRRAIYLDRNFALAHFHLGLALKRERQMELAARSFENVRRVLMGLPDDASLTAGDGITVTDLKALAEMHLDSKRQDVKV